MFFCTRPNCYGFHPSDRYYNLDQIPPLPFKLGLIRLQLKNRTWFSASILFSRQSVEPAVELGRRNDSKTYNFHFNAKQLRFCRWTKKIAAKSCFWVEILWILVWEVREGVVEVVVVVSTMKSISLPVPETKAISSSDNIPGSREEPHN